MVGVTAVPMQWHRLANALKHSGANQLTVGGLTARVWHRELTARGISAMKNRTSVRRIHVTGRWITIENMQGIHQGTMTVWLCGATTWATLPPPRKGAKACLICEARRETIIQTRDRTDYAHRIEAAIQ